MDETAAVKPPRDGRRQGAVALLVLALVVPAYRASAQCMVSSGPNLLAPGAIPPEQRTVWGSSAKAAVTSSDGSRVVALTEWGFVVFNASSNPASPSNIGSVDLYQNAYLGDRLGDGQTDLTDLAISADGSRVVASTDGRRQQQASALVFVPGTGIYRIGGDFSGHRSLVGIQQVAGKTFAYALPSTPNDYLRMADITNPPGWVANPGHISISKGNIATTTTAFRGGSQLQLADNFLFYQSGTTIKILDARNVASTGLVGGSSYDVPKSAWARTSSESLGAFSAAVDPTSGGNRIYLVGEFYTTVNQQSTGFTLLKWESGTTSVVGTFLPPPPYSGPGSVKGDSVSLQSDASTSSVNVLMWGKAIAAGGLPQQFVLYSTSVTNWILRAAPLASGPIDGSLFKGGKMSVFRRSGTETDVYLADGANPWAIKLSCIPPNSPATSSLRVEPVPCPGGAASCPLADGATVFLGDTLKISPAVFPPDAFKPVSGWRLDDDFHAGSTEDSGPSYPRLAQPDETGSGNPPASFLLVGPCDESAGGDPATGSNCWNSVRTNSATGGPDFTGSPAAGATKVLQIAFEANNALGSGNLATQSLTWKVPTVRLAAPAILAGAAVQDGSDGHPSAAGYRWYFGTSPAAPPGETLSRDAGCSGPSCPHTFPGPGTYNVWLTVPYPNGYTTPDCGGPCTAPAGGLTVKLTEVSLALKVGGLSAPPTIVTSSAGQVAVDEAGTQKAGGVTITSYRWCTAPAPGLCDPGGFPGQTFGSLPAQIPLPPVGTHNLFVKVYYTGGTASPADWTPNAPGADSPRAWRLTVVSPPPQISFVSGVLPCFVGCADVYTTLGTQVTAKVVVGGLDAGSPASSWSIVPAIAGNPNTGNGATFTFVPTSATDMTLTLTDGGQTAQRTISGVAPPPLVLSATASPTTAPPGTSVTFSATASGGTGSYASYSWTFGDGNTGSGASVSHSYASASSYSVTCTVTDSLGTTKTATVPLTVASTPTRFYTLPSCRVFDTRNAGGADAAAPALVAQATRLFALGSRCGIPAAASAISVNVTVTGPEADGFLTLYPGDVATPSANTISFRTGQTRANNSVVKLSVDGAQTFAVLDASAGAVHFVLDVNGYFR